METTLSPASNPTACDPEDIALKSFFLGPQAENGAWVRQMMTEVLDRWFQWRKDLFPRDGAAISVHDQDLPEFQERRRLCEETTRDLLTAFEKEVPKFSPRYIGHMVSEIALPALFGHFVALLHNPNNISGESSRVGIVVEDEAIRALLDMVGFKDATADGHFTSGGTVANFEALVRARARVAAWLSRGVVRGRAVFEAAHMGWEEFEKDAAGRLRQDMAEEDLAAKELACHFVEHPLTAGSAIHAATGTTFHGPVVLVPNHKHYSWQKGVSLLGLGRDAFWPVELDGCGEMSIADLQEKIEKAHRENRPILMVVTVAGTTELGHVDPVAKVQACLDNYRNRDGWHIWHHVDAAFGGFFCCLDKEDREVCDASLKESLSAIGLADSITLDPHKLGYVPYASGTILVRSVKDYRLVPWSAPYIQFDGRDHGPFSLEGSRPATGAAATWMIAKTVGFTPQGYGRILKRTIRMRKNLGNALLPLGSVVRQTPHMNTNVLCFHLAHAGEPLSQSNARTAAFIKRLSDIESGGFMVSKTELSRDSYRTYVDNFVNGWDAVVDTDRVLLVRMVLMNVFFESKEMTGRISEEFIEALRKFLSE